MTLILHDVALGNQPSRATTHSLNRSPHRGREESDSHKFDTQHGLQYLDYSVHIG